MKKHNYNATTINKFFEWIRDNIDKNSNLYKTAKDYLDREQEGYKTKCDAKRPFLSIVTRTQGKRREMLTETLLCLTGQTDTDFELLIVGHNLDNKKTKTVTEVIEEMPQWMQEKTRLVHVKGGNRTKPLNAGFEAAKGEYIAILDDDDIVFDNWVEEFRKTSEENPGTILHCYTFSQEWCVVKKNGEDIPFAVAAPNSEFCRDFVLRDELKSNVCPPVSLAFPAYSFHENGIRFDETLTTTEDWDFLVRTALLTGVSNNKTPTSIYRLWRNAENSKTMHSEIEWEDNYCTILKKFNDCPVVIPEGILKDDIKWLDNHIEEKKRQKRQAKKSKKETKEKLTLKQLFKSVKNKYFKPQEKLTPKTNNFNIMRFVAAIMVIYGHMAAIMGVSPHTVCGQAVSSLGVKIFFAISGYLITKSYLTDSNKLRYLIKRCLRIFPGLIAVVLVAAFIIGPFITRLPLNEYFTNPATYTYLLNILLFPIYSLPGVFENNIYPVAVNGSLWSLPVEFAMYLLLPLLIVLFKKLKMLRPGILVTALAFLIADCLKIAYFPSARVVFWGTNWADALSLIPVFFIGSLLSFPEFKKYLNLQFATALMILVSLVSLDTLKSEIAVALVLPYFTISFALTEKPFFGNWFNKADFSYGIYLYGFIIQQLAVLYWGNKGLTLNEMTFICTVITFVLAVASWYLVEKPAQSFSHKITNLLKLREARKRI